LTSKYINVNVVELLNYLDSWRAKQRWYSNWLQMRRQ